MTLTNRSTIYRRDATGIGLGMFDAPSIYIYVCVGVWVCHYILFYNIYISIYISNSLSLLLSLDTV